MYGANEIERTLQQLGSTAVAALLLGAALLKLASALPQADAFGPTSAVVLTGVVVFVEIAAGLCITRLPTNRFTWVIVALLFLCFLATGSWRLWHGVTECSCFGRMRSPISVSVAVSLLVLCFSGWQIRQNGSTSIREWATVARTSLTITFAVLLLATLGHPAFAGWAKAGTLITREHGHIEGPVPDDHGPGTLPVKVDLANTGSGLARIVGARQTCGVSVTTEFPILLQAGESTPIDFYAKFDDQSALEGTTQISLYVADANQLREQVFAITVPFRGPFSSSNGR